MKTPPQGRRVGCDSFHEGKGASNGGGEERKQPGAFHHVDT